MGGADVLHDLLAQGPVPADGAMGTALIARGLPPGVPPEAWLLTPEGASAIGAVHAGHVGTGARILLTASFGASPIRLADSSVAGRVDAVCRAAVAAARAGIAEARSAGTSATGVDRPAVLVAGDIGPTGALLAPYGELDPAAARESFGIQAAALAAAGADLLWIETMTDLAEARIAVEGARDAAPDLPIVATLTFERGRTLFGDRPEAAAAALAAAGVAAVGANCGNGFQAVLDVLHELAAGAPDLPLVAKANAGRPVVALDGTTTYPATPAEAAAYARRAADLGAAIVGGCCGTTDAHVGAIARALARP